MAYIYATYKTRTDKQTGKRIPVLDKKGQPVRHPYFRAEIRNWDGTRTTVTIPCRNRSEAQRQADLMQLKQDQIKAGERPPPVPADRKPPKGIREAAEEYLRWGECQGGRGGRPWAKEHARTRRLRMVAWIDRLKLRTMDDLQGILPAVEEECHARLKAGMSGKTIKHEAETLTAFIRWAKPRGYIDNNPLEGLGRFNTKQKIKRRVMSREEMAAFMACVPPHLQLLFEVAICSGLRRNELYSLTPDHLDATRCGLILEADWTKNRQDGFQPLPRSLFERLAAYSKTGDAKERYRLAFRQCGAKLHCPDDPLLYVPKATATTMDVYLAKAGIPKKTKAGKLDFHALRVAYINMLIEAGVDVKTIQTLARHSTLELTMNVYARAVDEKLRQGVESLGNMIPLPASTITSPEPEESAERIKDITPAKGEGYEEKIWCREWDLNPHDLAATGF